MRNMKENKKTYINRNRINAEMIEAFRLKGGISGETSRTLERQSKRWAI